MGSTPDESNASPAHQQDWGLIKDETQEARERSAALEDPGAYHGRIAAAELHWFETDSWLRQDPDSRAWSGFAADDGSALPNDARSRDWQPWERAFDDREAPFYRWFQGAKTNACFNEVDRHVLAGNGSREAFCFEGDRWDPSRQSGRGGPVVERTITYRELLLETVLRAEVLVDLGLETGDRIAFNLPNIPEQLFYTEAAKRLGLIYTPVFGGFSAKTLSDRIHDAGAKVVVTADGGYRNAEVVPFKGIYTDPALDNFIPLSRALETLDEVLSDLAGKFGLEDRVERLAASIGKALAGEITIERSDLMRELGRALAREDDLPPDRTATIRTTVARRLAEVGHAVEQVIVVRYTGQDIVEQPRDRWSHALVDAALERVLERARDAGFEVADRDDLLKLDDHDLWQALNASHPATPVAADWPLFIIYTSGSTGKPKGVVHTHGGWLAGITHTLRPVFGATQDDRLYVIADPGWITGQSYLIAAPLAFGMTSIVAEGSPLFPHAGRFSSIIERHKASLFKAGSTFLKAVMTDPESAADMTAFDMTGLKAATFCAEPVSPAVQQFAMDQVCEHYINSYWATEHGGIVFSCPWDSDKPLQADAKTWSLPWIEAEVRIAEETDETGRASRWRKADRGEKGELVITRPYPYLARTIWGDAGRLGSEDWKGDLERFRSVYFDRWHDSLAYTQGDYARHHEDGSFTLHGRSDDVINVSGHRIGTEEIEGAILRDKVLRPDSPLGNAVVVGSPHDEKGETPVAFVIAAPGARLKDEDLDRFRGLVRSEKGVTAVPSDFLVVSAFPETRSGKYMRRTLRAILLDEPLGDVSTLRNPEVIDEIRSAVEAWQAFGRLGDARDIVQTHRYLRLENHAVGDGRKIALLTIDHPPVNSLNERSLDELYTVLQHIANRTDLAALVVTGAGSAFVAGADVKELLEVGEAGDLESAATPPNAAHAAFSALENLDLPVIAAVNGAALGGGNELVLACAYVIADTHARFGQPEINLNLLPGYGGTQRLPRRLNDRSETGLVDAARLIIGGRAIDADEARDIGLVDEIVGRDGHGPVAVAMERIRDWLRNEGPLVAAMEAQRRRLDARESPLPWRDELLEDPRLAPTVAQARASGREQPVERILDALAFGAGKGQSAGLKHEARLFAEAVCDPQCGPPGITAFLERRSAPLPLRHTDVAPLADAETREALESDGRLLPLEAPFYPGVTPIPDYQYGMGVTKDSETALPAHGDPADAERLLVFPTPKPGPNEALVFLLASEVNFNDIWAITGIPVSPFDARDADLQVTGSGGVALIASLGEELVREGRLAVGQLVTIYSGQSELLSPDQGLDPMAADFHIQGYEINDGSHAQFLVVQGPQLQPKLPGLTIEQAAASGLTQGTIHRALFRTLDIEPGRRLFVEGASTGTGLECLRAARRSGLSVAGLVSSDERAERVREHRGVPVNRKDPRWKDIFTPVPDDESEWDAWEKAGEPFVAAITEGADGPIDYVVSHAGELAFPRSFQALGPGGVLTFFGATSGYRFSFMGKPGDERPDTMFTRAGLRAGQALLVVYGPGAEDGIVDPVAVEAIEAGCARGSRVAVLADTVAQREFVTSLGFGAQLTGVVSLEEIGRRLGDDFDPPGPLAPMPDPFTESAAFKEAVRAFSDRTLKPIGSAIGPLLRTTLDRRGLPDMIFERRGRDGLPLATSLVKPNVGRVVYSENLAGRRFSFYAPQVWMRQRQILMPTAEIRGTHLNTAREYAEVLERIASGMVDVVDPVPVPLKELPSAHQAMWTNSHAGATYVATHGLPRAGLKTRDELYRAWAIREAEAQGIELRRVDTGSAGSLK
ncbi:MAG: AMP-binding protein [Gammaproteobacteria bacterium]|jgi:acrylyl-CoA reductase (NADPH)/3-hydroxypropionyl-CoA dehydratase/3-hydroxypropionyl-CoA synthetase|nr:AMP-binding protein [Gammaproteobacteria bacterium]